MEAKLKAQELVDKYYNLLFTSMEINWVPEAKRCALIAVDEILREYAVLQIETNFCYEKYLYWDKVKSEIEKYRNGTKD